MTGQDFPKLEAVVSVGRDNNEQPFAPGGGGRLCRMSRLLRTTSRSTSHYILTQCVSKQINAVVDKETRNLWFVAHKYCCALAHT